MLQLDEDTVTIERQLHRWRFHPAVAHEALRWALAQESPSVAPVETRRTTRSLSDDVA
jgi:hypothetical protein